MKTQPKVSVIMPAYNAEAFIREAVDSILAQTYTDFELIILDDGSKDTTPKIIETYDDSRIRLIRKENEGVAATLNRGIQLAKGEFIWRHDADDISLPNKLHREISFLQDHPDCLLVATQAAFMTARGRIAWRKKQPKDQWLGKGPVKWVAFEDFDPFSPITHGTALIRMSAFEKAGYYRTQFITSEDIDMWLRMMDFGPLAVLNDCLSLHRISGTSATAVHGWKNEFYRERAKDFWRQRQLGGPDELEIQGMIDEPPPPQTPLSDAPKKGMIMRSDLLNFHLAVHVDARDWLEVARIIQICLRDGWKLPEVYQRITLSCLPSTVINFIVSVKAKLR